MPMRSGLAVVVVCLVSASAVSAQDTSAPEIEARSRALSERMRVSLEQQSRVVSQMQRDLELAARVDSRVRDSIVRSTSQRIAELVSQLARVQMEADRVQTFAVDAQTRAQLTTQIASARAIDRKSVV